MDEFDIKAVRINPNPSQNKIEANSRQGPLATSAQTAVVHVVLVLITFFVFIAGLRLSISLMEWVPAVKGREQNARIVNSFEFKLRTFEQVTDSERARAKASSIALRNHEQVLHRTTSSVRFFGPLFYFLSTVQFCVLLAWIFDALYDTAASSQNSLRLTPRQLALRLVIPFWNLLTVPELLGKLARQYESRVTPRRSGFSAFILIWGVFYRITSFSGLVLFLYRMEIPKDIVRNSFWLTLDTIFIVVHLVNLVILLIVVTMLNLQSRVPTEEVIDAIVIDARTGKSTVLDFGYLGVLSGAIACAMCLTGLLGPIHPYSLPEHWPWIYSGLVVLGFAAGFLPILISTMTHSQWGLSRCLEGSALHVGFAPIFLAMIVWGLDSPEDKLHNIAESQKKAKQMEAAARQGNIDKTVDKEKTKKLAEEVLTVKRERLIHELQFNPSFRPSMKVDFDFNPTRYVANIVAVDPVDIPRQTQKSTLSDGFSITRISEIDDCFRIIHENERWFLVCHHRVIEVDAKSFQPLREQRFEDSIVGVEVRRETIVLTVQRSNEAGSESGIWIINSRTFQKTMFIPFVNVHSASMKSNSHVLVATKHPRFNIVLLNLHARTVQQLFSGKEASNVGLDKFNAPRAANEEDYVYRHVSFHPVNELAIGLGRQLIEWRFNHITGLVATNRFRELPIDEPEPNWTLSHHFDWAASTSSVQSVIPSLNERNSDSYPLVAKDISFIGVCRSDEPRVLAARKSSVLAITAKSSTIFQFRCENNDVTAIGISPQALAIAYKSGSIYFLKRSKVADELFQRGQSNLDISE